MISFKIAKLGVILSLFTPLILGIFGMTLSAHPKAVFFRSFIDIAFIFYLFLICKKKEHFPKLSPLILFVLAFDIVLFLTSLFGLNFFRSFFGTADRSEGLILHIHLFLFLLMLLSLFKDEWIKLFKWSFGIASLSALAAVIQKLGIAQFYGNSLPDRLSGTLANPDFFGSYISLAIFIGLIVFFLEKEKDYKIAWFCLILICFLTLVLSYTRAAIGGFIIGLAVLLFLSFWHSDFFQKRRLALLLCLLGFLAVALMLVSNYENWNLQRYYFASRFMSSFEIMNSSRLAIWKIAIDGWLQSPLLGRGIEMFGFVFDQNFKSEYVSSIGEMYYDYAHNKYLEILVGAGIIGLASFLLIFFWIFCLLFKSIRKNAFGEKSWLISSVLISFLATYLVQNIFAFDTIANYILLFLVIGFVDSNFSSSFIRVGERAFFEKIKLPSFIIISAVLLLFLYRVNIKPALASLNYNLALKNGAYPEKSYKDTFLKLKKASLSGFPYSYDINIEVAKAFIFYVEMGRAEEMKKESIDFLLEISKKAEQSTLKPEIKRVTAFEFSAKAYYVSYLKYKNEKDLAKAKELLEKLNSFNNQFLRSYKLLCQVEIVGKNYAKGEEYCQRAFELSSKSVKDKIVYYRNLGAGYFFAGETKKYADSYKKSIDLMHFISRLQPDVFNDLFDNSLEEASKWINVALVFCKDLKDKESCYDIYEKTIQAFPEYGKILQKDLNALKNLY